MKNSSAKLSIAFSQIGHSMSHIFMLLYPTCVLALEKEFHKSYGELLVLMTLGNVLFGVAALPAGWLGDRWSTLGMMIIFFLGLGASAIFTGFMSTTGGLVLGLALIGLFASIYHPVGMAWLVKNSENKGRALGINGVFGSLGVASAALIAGILTDTISWRAAFIVPGVLALVVGVALIYCVKRGLVATSFADVKPFVKPPASDMKRVFIVLSFTMLLNGIIYQSVSSALPKILAEGAPNLSGGTAAGAGVLVSIVYLCAMIASLLGGYLIRPLFSEKFVHRHHGAASAALCVSRVVDAFTADVCDHDGHGIQHDRRADGKRTPHPLYTGTLARDSLWREVRISVGIGRARRAAGCVYSRSYRQFLCVLHVACTDRILDCGYRVVDASDRAKRSVDMGIAAKAMP